MFKKRTDLSEAHAKINAHNRYIRKSFAQKLFSKQAQKLGALKRADLRPYMTQSLLITAMDCQISL